MRQVIPVRTVQAERLDAITYTPFQHASYTGITVPLREFALLIARKTDMIEARFAYEPPEYMEYLPTLGGGIANRQPLLLRSAGPTPVMVMLDKRWATGSPRWLEIDITGGVQNLQIAVLTWSPHYSTTNK